MILYFFYVIVFIFIECDDGLYGQNCNKNCSGISGHCMNITSCNHVTGQCDNGCAVGWTETLCDKGYILNHFLNLISFIFHN